MIMMMINIIMIVFSEITY